MEDWVQITVLGAGAFGTAMSVALRSAVSDVVLWSRNQRVVDELRTSGENLSYLAGSPVPRSINVTTDLELALQNTSVVLLCVPTQELRNLCNIVKDSAALRANVPVLVCSKGIESESLKFAGEIVAEVLPSNPTLVLSGPALAREMVQGLPCAMVLAGDDIHVAASLAGRLSSPSVSVVHSSDYLGVQIGSVLKNVIAIACGIVAGRKLGHNATTMVIVQGLAEIQALCTAKTGHADIATITGLACLGDLVLTCTSSSSRNMSFGLSIGQSNNVNDKASAQVLVEGAESAQSVENLGLSLGVDLPICYAVSRLLKKQLTVDQLINQILHSPFNKRHNSAQQ
ncbi:NAD(P)H-dependent glycerol-3-phosphate dehydrogenase [Candidatus Anaplasma sp. TIGMIC]|uniref:NAD(P)H-dependent glycerol-3-phosphate dehydrogenase n=1 Tax=Candidatus Anaplasma sp. TIGMIC TaxID=3020713 RepID=UPI00232F9D25|nr:NAD(P)H-dependent glycerol-3-phosphate dehydrogenase [Candidatus Anaplasma sp. TIGMIC]MDB1135549.1 NAD(P)-dependent glycerol-3-phosphate dehydrogenase [Candidatus Anaplasma sp. TIGMIC]